MQCIIMKYPSCKGMHKMDSWWICGEDWSRKHNELMLERGLHRLANGKNSVCQLCQETDDKVKYKYAIIVKWGDIKNDVPKKLKYHQWQ